MKIFTLTLLLGFSFVQSQTNCESNKMRDVNKLSANKSITLEKDDSKNFDKLPDGVKLTDKVRTEFKGEDGETTYRIITVEEKLKEIGAKFDQGKLVDSKRKEIRFYKPPVRGASQGFEEDQKQQARDAEELKKLKEKFTVIILYINPLEVM